MIIIAIIAVLVIGLFLFLFLFPKRERLVERTPVSRAQALSDMRQAAKSMRCGELAKKGVSSCKRAAGRPCVSGCRGRIDIEIDYTE